MTIDENNPPSIRSLRLARDWSQHELARRARCSRTIIQYHERRNKYAGGWPGDTMIAGRASASRGLKLRKRLLDAFNKHPVAADADPKDVL